MSIFITEPFLLVAGLKSNCLRANHEIVSRICRHGNRVEMRAGKLLVLAAVLAADRVLHVEDR